MFRKLMQKREWKKTLKKTDKYSYNFCWTTFKLSLTDLLAEALDYMFIPDVERICYEIIETIGNINVMLQTDNEDEYKMSKDRVIYMLENRFEEWYI